MPEPFKEGDVVFLNSGSPLLTVEVLGYGEDDLVNVVWMVEGLVQRDRFHRTALISYTEAATQNQLANYKAGNRQCDA